MKFIEPSVQIIQQEPGIDGMMKIIEMAGRTAYKSEDKITDNSAKKFVKMLKQRNHGAALEHGTCYITIPHDTCVNKPALLECLRYHPYIYCFSDGDSVNITTNYRVLVETGLEGLLDYMVEPTKQQFKNNEFLRRVTVKFICDRGVSHEAVRHRVFSFLQESTRYCNYSKDKYGNEITYIIPRWIYDIYDELIKYNDPLTGESYKKILDNWNGDIVRGLACYDRTVSDFVSTLKKIEDCYINMLTQDDGTKLVPQQARQVLPNALKTELIMTGTVGQWGHFFSLRCAKDAHPDMRYLAIKLKEEFIVKGYVQ